MGSPAGLQRRRGRRAPPGDAELRELVELKRQQMRPELSRLAADKARLKTQSVYLGALKAFFVWLRLGRLPVRSRADWGSVAVEFAEWLFDRG